MKLRVLCAALVAASATSAFAVGPGSLGSIDNKPTVIGNSVSGPLLFDVYTFSLADSGTLSGIAASLDLKPLLSFSPFSVVLQNSAMSVIGTDTTPSDGFSFTGLTAGSYALTFVGMAGGSLGGSYGGSVFASTVPEPESMALLLAGLGAMGFVISRRRRNGV
jgi:hypothetical protein